MDQGVNLPFSSNGIDPAEFGMPIWEPKWHKVIITGSAAKPLADATQGGRLQLKIKNEAGQEGFIGLNLWHVDADTKARAERELASICHVTGKHQFNNTAELYNVPFFVLAETYTGAPSPKYPNPKPMTQFRGYRDLNGNEPGKSGGGAGPSNGPPANFGGAAPQQQAPAYAPQQGPLANPGGQQFAPNGGAPAPAFQQQQAPAFQPQQQAPFAPQGQAPAQQFQQPQQQQAPAFQQPNAAPMQPNTAPQWNPQGAAAPAQAFQQQPPAGFAPQGQPQQQQPAYAPQGGGAAPWGPQG